MVPACALAMCLAVAGVAAAPAWGRGAAPQTGQAPTTTQSRQTGGGAGTSSLVSAALEQCLTAVDPASRSATFSGQMTAVTGTWRMAMRIDLQERKQGETYFHTINAAGLGESKSGLRGAAGLGEWKRSEAGVKIYKYVKHFTNLPAPAAVRALVQFHWLNERGRLIKRTERHTSVCVQPDQRPKLVLGGVRIAPQRGSPLANYRIVVENAGHSPAIAFGVGLDVNGSLQPLLQAPVLEPGARAVLDAQAPRCTPGSTVEIQLDPLHQVEEALGGGMSDTVPCPAPDAESS